MTKKIDFVQDENSWQFGVPLGIVVAGKTWMSVSKNNSAQFKNFISSKKNLHFEIYNKINSN